MYSNIATYPVLAVVHRGIYILQILSAGRSVGTVYLPGDSGFNQVLRACKLYVKHQFKNETVQYLLAGDFKETATKYENIVKINITRYGTHGMPSSIS